MLQVSYSKFLRLQDCWPQGDGGVSWWRKGVRWVACSGGSHSPHLLKILLSPSSKEEKSELESGNSPTVEDQEGRRRARK